MFQIFEQYGEIGSVFRGEYSSHIDAVQAMYSLMDNETGMFFIRYSGV